MPVQSWVPTIPWHRVSCLHRLYDIRSHKGALRFPTPGINIFLGWNVADPHVLATVSDSNVVTFLDMRKGKYLKTVKNRQEVSRSHSSVYLSHLW